MPRPAKSTFNTAFSSKKVPEQRRRTWTTDPDTGLSDIKCGCGVSIKGYAGDPKHWAEELHVCSYWTLNTWTGVP